MTVNSIEERRFTARLYNHSRLESRRNFLRLLIRWIGVPLLAKVRQVEGIENIPTAGPAILMINHVSFADSLLVLHFCPRNLVPLAKIEVYDYPVVGIFPRLWQVIPVRREGVDRKAIQQALDVLAAGEIILLAPEGTRHTELHQGKEGVAFLASRSGAPIVPVAIDGTQGFPALRFTAPWRTPGAQIKFGKPFRFRPELKHAKGEALRQMTDEAMYCLAGMLPPERRGVYKDLEKASRDTIEVS